MKLFAALPIVLFSAACSDRPAPGDDSSKVTALAVPVSVPVSESSKAAAAKSRSLCPHDGKWALCSVERRLKQSGFVVKRVEGEPPKRPGFSVKPTVFSLGSSKIEVFIYKDDAAVARDVAEMDTVAVAPRGATAAWEMPPIFIRSGNLLAVLLTQNARQAERAVLAITAGAPQPGSPR